MKGAITAAAFILLGILTFSLKVRAHIHNQIILNVGKTFNVATNSGKGDYNILQVLKHNSIKLVKSE